MMESHEDIELSKTKGTSFQPAANQEKPDEDGETCMVVDSEQQHSADVATPAVPRYPKWLRIHLLVSNITVGLMFVVAMVNLSFAGVMKEDLEDE